MADLAAWLLEQIEADEAAARVAAHSPLTEDPRWVVEETGECDYTVRYERSRWELTEGAKFCSSDAEHIARWDPARVLAECEAKRRIVERLVSAHAASEAWLTGGRDLILEITDEALRLLAQPYADRPGFREEWRLATRAGADA